MKRKDQRDYRIWGVQDAVAFLLRELNCTAVEASLLLAGGAGDIPPPKAIVGDERTFHPNHLKDWTQRHRAKLKSCLGKHRTDAARAAY